MAYFEAEGCTICCSFVLLQKAKRRSRDYNYIAFSEERITWPSYTFFEAEQNWSRWYFLYCNFLCHTFSHFYHKLFFFQKSKFCSKIAILAKNQNFGQKFEICPKKWNFHQKSKFSPKIEIFAKNRKYCQKLHGNLETESINESEFFN